MLFRSGGVKEADDARGCDAMVVDLPGTCQSMRGKVDVLFLFETVDNWLVDDGCWF